MDAVIARVDKRKSHDTAFSEDGRLNRPISAHSRVSGVVDVL